MLSAPDPAVACPSCGAPLVHLRVRDDLALRSCSRCDSRWWTRADEPADLESVLDAVAGRVRPAVVTA